MMDCGRCLVAESYPAHPQGVSDGASGNADARAASKNPHWDQPGGLFYKGTNSPLHQESGSSGSAL